MLDSMNASRDKIGTSFAHQVFFTKVSIQLTVGISRHHRHLGLVESVWTACLEAADVPFTPQ
eukprot:COSAG02_NODE_541_length_20598_cov_278.953754_10_plen_62_part_00